MSTSLFVFVALAWLSLGGSCALAQPSECAEDDQINHCPDNKFCENGRCLSCVNCTALNRISPAVKCVRSLRECGECQKGFMEDRSGEGGEICVPAREGALAGAGAKTGAADDQTHGSNLLIILVVVGVALLCVIFGIGCWFALKKDTNMCDNKVATSIIASQDHRPTAPPPYIEPYNGSYNYPSEQKRLLDEGAAYQQHRDLESAQGARLANPPSYVRIPQIGESPEAAAPFVPLAPPALPDEPTLDSVWQPGPSQDNTDHGSARAPEGGGDGDGDGDGDGEAHFRSVRRHRQGREEGGGDREGTGVDREGTGGDRGGTTAGWGPSAGAGAIAHSEARAVLGGIEREDSMAIVPRNEGGREDVVELDRRSDAGAGTPGGDGGSANPPRAGVFFNIFVNNAVVDVDNHINSTSHGPTASGSRQRWNV